MITISSGFIGSFKLGDNIVHNLAILRELYNYQAAGNAEQRELLRKPIVLLIASVTEAVLFDLYLRISRFTREGVANIPDDVLDEIRNKTIDEFAKYIDNAKSKSLLDTDTGLYDALHELRKLRNRVHIQNTKSHFEPNESETFNAARQLSAQQTLENVMKIMEEQYPRQMPKHVADFILPWDSHIADT